MIQSNPFTSHLFVSYWSKHFLASKKGITFNFTNSLLFYKSKIPGIYINIGKKLTKGVSYELGEITNKGIKNKTFLIYDVIQWSERKEAVFFTKNYPLGYHNVKQYPGYLVNLKDYSNLDEFMSKTFKKSSRYKLRKYKNRLEGCFDISFKSFGPKTTRKEYDSIFDKFRQLLEKRFNQKRVHNNNLDKNEWNFYNDVAFPLIQERKATLFVLFNKNEAISITLAYFSDNRIFDAITVFDIDYSKFQLGSIKIMYLIDWAIQNNWGVLDFSKGHFDYKTRWSNEKYYFHYHILYDKTSLYSKLIATFLKYFFELKQFLRDKNLNEFVHRLTYKLKNKKTLQANYSFIEYDDFNIKYDVQLVSIDKPSLSFLKNICYNFLYLYQEKESDLKVFKVSSRKNIYLLVGQRAKTFVKLTA